MRREYLVAQAPLQNSISTTTLERLMQLFNFTTQPTDHSVIFIISWAYTLMLMVKSSLDARILITT